MTPEQQRIAIAEACGWTDIAWLRIHAGNEDYWSSKHVGDWEYTTRGPLPDYLNDLNAMHEAEKVLFARNDWSVCKYDELLGAATSSWKWNATAAQRAEAFLRTIKKWEETP